MNSRRVSLEAAGIPIDDDEGMLRMSFLGHLEELRKRIMLCLLGLGIAMVLSFSFTWPLWDFVQEPGRQALLQNGAKPELVMVDPLDGMNIIWFKLPLVCSIFLASPWVLYQGWAFISPGLYRRERRWVVPIIGAAAGFFVLGGIFGYLVVFRFALTFLLGIGRGRGVIPMVTVTAYFDRFVDVILGVAVVFELPVATFILILLRLATPAFLLRHSRYAILAIFTIAAVITPTTDMFNMTLFAVPMCLLFFVGVFAGYVLEVRRRGASFPWNKVLIITVAVLLLVAAMLYLAITHYGYRLVPQFPFMIR